MDTMKKLNYMERQKEKKPYKISVLSDKNALILVQFHTFCYAHLLPKKGGCQTVLRCGFSHNNVSWDFPVNKHNFTLSLFY